MIVDPVPTTLLFCGGGVAGIYGVAFIPFLRGRGIGGAISLKPLLDARDEGYRHAVLFASEEGRDPYVWIGFRDGDVRINRFPWRND